MNLQVGDVLMGREDVELDAPYGRVWWKERWLPMTFDPEMMCVILAIKGMDDDEVQIDVASLNTGDKFLFVLTIADIATKMMIIRGKSVVAPEGCDTVDL